MRVTPGCHPPQPPHAPRRHGLQSLAFAAPIAHSWTQIAAGWHVKQLRSIFDVGLDAFYAFLADDGWAIASHIALSALMALFPFLIVVTSLAGFLGSKDLADQAAALMLETWPTMVANALSGEIHDVLTTTRGDAFTVGLVLAIYFASNGVESLRVGLNRAYGMVELRRWYWLRLESIGYTMIAAVVSLALSFLIVLGPLIIAALRRHFPLMMESNENLLDVARYGLAILALIVALLILHAWLPAGRRGLLQILPGIVFTLVASLVSGIVFGQYLARFANNYVTTYAGLASVIIALVFLYFIAAIFIYGGELNAAIIKSRRPGPASPRQALSQVPGD
jgi:membrane protein